MGVFSATLVRLGAKYLLSLPAVSFVIILLGVEHKLGDFGESSKFAVRGLPEHEIADRPILDTTLSSLAYPVREHRSALRVVLERNVYGNRILEPTGARVPLSSLIRYRDVERGCSPSERTGTFARSLATWCNV